MLNEGVGDLVEVEGRPFLKTKPGLSGHAVYGHYLTLQPGQYRVNFYVKPLSPSTGERDPLIAVVDVQASLEVTLAEGMVFRSDLVDGEWFAVEFGTEQEMTGVEFRLYVNGSEPLLIGDASAPVPIERRNTMLRRGPPSLVLQEHSKRIWGMYLTGASVAALGQELLVTLSGQSFRIRAPEDIRLLDNLASQGGAHTAISSGVASAVIIVLGTATVFSEIGYALVGHLMDVVYGGYRRLHCSNLAQLRELWGEQRSAPILITSDCPDTALSYLLTTSSFPILAFFDDPVTALAYPAVVESQPLRDAIRFGARRFSCLMGCAGSLSVHFFDEESQMLSLDSMVDAIFAAVGLEPGEAAARVVERFASAEGVRGSVAIEEIVRRRMKGHSLAGAGKHFDAAEQRLIAWFADNYGPLLKGREREIIEWPLELFYVGPNGEAGDRDVDLIGGARYIFWGPYLHLPFGGWRVHLQFEVAGNVSGNEIEADVFVSTTATQVARCQAKLPVQGYFQFSFDFVNIDPNAVIEFRVRLIRGAIEGRFGVRRVTLTPISAPSGLAAVQTMQSMQAS